MQLTQGLVPQLEAVSLNSLKQQKHPICPCNMVGKALTQKRLEGTGNQRVISRSHHLEGR